ncbi:MAG: T9SS type A sorting domain-containing protein [Saprospirales bacterium]|nr:T9SS type A sorting domain-containing protein [Saprospirales bacterium]
MRQILLLCLFLLCASAVSFAQITVLDFETPGTTTSFQYFGSPLDGSLNQTIPNPNSSGINTSATVAEFIKPAGAQTQVWAGAFSNPNPTVLLDATTGKICVKVHMDHLGNLGLKMENSTNGGSNWITTVPNTLVNQWEELCFDFNIPSIELPNAPAAGFIYQTLVFFFDFGTGGGATDVTSYLDDVTIHPDLVVTPILDFETAPFTTNFQYFGSTLDGTFTSVIPNPNSSGINTSANVVEYIKPLDAQVWAGAFSNPNPTTLLDVTTAGQVCVKVHMDHIGNLNLKLENSTTGGSNWGQTVANTLVNEWEELCFDVSIPSNEAPNTPAAGHIYQTVTVFFDFQVEGANSNYTSYFDDILIKGGGGPQQGIATFRVNMNDYSGSFTNVYVSGGFNNWSGDANPMADPDADGIWEAEIPLFPGVIEYKFTIDNWAAQEEFNGLEECTITDPSGQFHNRKLVFAGDEILPAFCFNSCYECGQSVSLTFELGMGDVTPSPDGVWLCGGGNFDSPGGRFKMDDSDADGVYTISIERGIGFESFFTFANGNCPDFSCKENIARQSCAQAQNFNDRFLPAIAQDTVVATCFGLCSDNSECIVSTRELAIDENLFSVQPTLTNGQVLVSFKQQDAQAKELVLLNALGQSISRVSLEAQTDSYELDLSQYGAGIYLIHVRMGDRMAMKKVVKE